MHSFCTLFDSLYLSRGLVLYDSITKNSETFHLYIFAFDDLCLKILECLHLPNVTAVSLKEFENEQLISIKDTRTKAEYCWTCTSSIIEFVLENYNVPSCTYVDADLFFYASPAVLLNELISEKSVLITEHRFSRIAKLFEQRRAGRFCVQFITFKNVKESREILNKWKNQCIDWCYARYEDGKFGDQKYLEDWPFKYPTVHILEHLGGGVAPWNVQQYNFFREENKIFGKVPKSKTKFEMIFFHFHFVRFLSNGYADLGWNRLQKDVIDIFYIPYIQKIMEKEKFLEKTFSEYKTGYLSGKPLGMRDVIKFLYKRITRFNLIKLPAV